MEDITVRFLDNFSEDEVNSPILIEGLPGIGHVGKLVAEHIIHELGAKKDRTNPFDILSSPGDYRRGRRNPTCK